MIWLLLVIGIFVGDGLCKKYMDRSLQEKEQRPVLGGHVILRKFHNPGAMLGLGKNRKPVLELVSALMTGALAFGWVRLLQEKGGAVLKLAMSFLLGGALSNVCDRIRQGFVVDYFSFRVPVEKLRHIVFNLSDMFIFAGAGLMIVYSFFKRK